MRKKIVLGLIIILICLSLYNKRTYAVISDIEIELHTFSNLNIYGAADTDEKKEALEELRNTYGYTGDSFPEGEETMKFITKIYILEPGDEREKI